MKKWTIIILFAMFACQEEKEPIPQSSLTANFSAEQALAQALSVHMGNQEVREFIKEKLIERFDGDYNFLIALHQYDLISDRIPFERMLETPENSISLRGVLEEYPLLQIAMPSLSGMTAEEWDIEQHIPMVIYRPVDTDLSQIKYLTAYRNGKPVKLSMDSEPEELVIVLSNNERTVAIPGGGDPRDKIGLGRNAECNIESIGSTGSTDYYLKEDLESCYSGNPSMSSADTDQGCDRDKTSKRDHVIRAKFTTMNYFRQAEHFLDGNPEVYFIVTLASKNPSGFSSLRKSFMSRDRSEWKNCGIFHCVPEWHEHRQPVFDWDKEVFGDLVRYDWFEEDFSKGKIDITLGLTSKFEIFSVSGSVKVSISKKDYFLDQDFVYYCDNTDGRGTDYNTGKIYFTVN